MEDDADFNLAEAMKGFAPPKEGDPTKDSGAVPMATFLPAMENFLTLKKVNDVLIIDTIEGGDPDDFDWEGLTAQQDAKDRLAYGFIYNGLSWQKKEVTCAPCMCV